MNCVIIGEEKSPDLVQIKRAFLEKGFDKVPFIKISKIGLFTAGNKTKIVVGKINFSKYDSVFLKVGPQFTQFVEPFLAELAEKGIYCQLKPESFYISSNKPFMFSVLASRGIPIPKTSIVPSSELIEQASKGFKFPQVFKTFVGQKKNQQIIVESERGLKSTIKSFKSKFDAVTIQEYLQEDLIYCVVVGKEILGLKRKWNSDNFEHMAKMVSTSLSGEDSETAFRACRTVGFDIALVRLIGGKVIDIDPIIDFDRFNKPLGKSIESMVAAHYSEKVNQ
ncbi:MAG: hypothetical protein ABID38_01580 [Candidatus Diapherotrites archaeon]